jgi:hypothetical protein
MRYWLLTLIALGVVQTSSNGQAEDPPPAGPLVSIEVEIVDVSPKVERLARLEAGGDDKYVARLRELEKTEKLTNVTRMRLSVLDQNVGSAQVGGRAPVVSGRSGFGNAQSGRGGGGFAEQLSLSLRDHGTIVRATPRVEATGSILLELQIERTGQDRPDREPAAEAVEAPAGQPSPRVMAALTGGDNTLSTKTTIRVKDGQTAVLQGVETTGEKSSQTVILVTARVSAAGAPAGAAKAEDRSRQLKLFSLQRAASREMAKVLTVLDESLVITSDDRTNTPIVSGPANKLAEAEALIMKLDEK